MPRAIGDASNTNHLPASLPRRSRPRVLGIGLVSLDLSCLLDDLPADGRVSACEAYQIAGGMVANTLVGLTRLGWGCDIVAAVADDIAGERATLGLETCGVSTEHLVVCPGGVTPTALCLASQQRGSRTVIGLPDQGCTVRARDLPAIPPGRWGAVHADGWHAAATVRAFDRARRAGVLTSYDGGWWIDAAGELAARADVLFVSADFVHALGGSAEQNEMIIELAEWVIERRTAAGVAGAQVQWIGFTAGSRGAWGVAVSGRASTRPAELELVHQPALPPAKMVDTTGAGDAFHAGLLHGRLSGWPLAASMRFAAAVAALACEGLGAQASLPSEPQVRRFLKQVSRER